jgi:hypothetical protein
VATPRATTESKRRARVGLLTQRFLHRARGVRAHARYPVGVAVEGKLYAGVAEQVLNVFRECPSPEQYGEAAMPLLTPPDPNLTLTRMQYPAIVGKAGNRKSFTYAGFAIPCNAQQPLTAHS